MTDSPERERFQRVQEILDEVLDLEGAERAAALARATAGDEELLREVRRLLEADASAGDFLEGVAVARAAPLIEAVEAARDGRDAAVGLRVGAWRLEQEIGRGGMGAVFRAERADGEFAQSVAVKLLKRGMDSDEIVRRFERERAILARLAHPNIARLLDGGVTQDGRPWFAMERVDGAPITRAVRERRLGLGERLALFLQVCDAVRFAHANLVVHRDLKPSNVLVCDEGGRPAAKLLDFGIAKLMQDGADAASLTRSEARLLTPAYAAPEQKSGQPVTTATDVYALGLLLSELVADAVHTRDLERIVAQATEEEPARRYPSVEALLDDVQRFRDGRPVAARRGGAWYRAAKFVRRNRLASAAALLLALALAGGLLATLWQADAARREARRAGEVRSFLVDLFRDADPEAAKRPDLSARDLLARATERIDAGLDREPEVRAELYRTLVELYQSLGLWRESLPVAERSLEANRAAHPAGSAAVEQALVALGEALRACDDAAGAERRFREALDQSRARAGAESREAASRMGSVAEALRIQGRHREAVELLEGAVAIARKSRDPGSRATLAACLHSLGTTLGAAERQDEAVPIKREALQLAEEIHGDRSTRTAAALWSLATSHLARGEFADARSCLERALAIQERLLGGAHGDVGETLMLLAAAEEGLGELEAAAEHCLRAVDVLAAALGANNSRAISARNSLAALQYRRGDYAASAASARAVLDAWLAVLPPDSPLLLTGRGNLAASLSALGDAEGAEAELREVVASARASFGPDSPRTALYEHNLGVRLLLSRELEEARELFAHALTVFESEATPRTGMVAQVLEGLASVSADLGDAAGAVEKYRRAIELREAGEAVDPLRLAEVRGGLGRSLRTLLRREEALEQLAAALTARELHAPGTPETAALAAEVAALRAELAQP